MADEEIKPIIKRVTLHPLDADGFIDLETNLYPKTLVDGVVDREGNEVDIATQDELDAAINVTDIKIESLENRKQDNIPDLEDIRSKANTAVQPEDLATVATTGSYHDLLDKPIIPEIPVADVLVNGESVVNEETVADIKLKTINDEAIEGEGNIEVVIPSALDDYYTKEEVDETTEALDERVDVLEDQVLVYDYFVGIPSPEVIPDDSDSDSEDEEILGGEIVFPIHKTKYNLLELSAKGRSDISTDCYVDLLEPEVLYSGEKILSNSTPITLYQTGYTADIPYERYGYDTFNLLEKKVYRYCLPITFRELFEKIPASLPNSEIKFEETNNGRLVIPHSTLANRVGVFTDANTILKYTKDIGLTYKGIGSSNFAITNIRTLDESISDKAAAIEKLCSDDYADVKIIFKRASVLVQERPDIEIEISAIPCNGIFQTGISGFGGCAKASYLSLKALVYSKDQCDAKFQTIANFNDFVSEYNANQYIVKIGDTSVEPTHKDYNKLDATLQVYSTVLKDAGYPKYACANCVEPADQTLGVAPYRGDTTFINAKNGNTYGYLVLSQGITYWVTKTKINDVDTDVVKQISLDPSNINVLDNSLAINNIDISSGADIRAVTITTNNLRENENQTSIISYDSDAYYTTVSQVGKIVAPSISDFDILQLEDSQNPGEFSNSGDTVRLMNVADPIDNLDAANKQYVDNREVSWDKVINKPADNSNLRNSAAAGSLFQVAPFTEGLTWSSDDTSVATVDENGHVEAISAGTATISVIDELGRTAECEVTVTAPAGRSLRKGVLRSAGEETWEKITKASELPIGSTVVLVYEQGTMELTGISSTSTKYGVGTAYTTAPAGTFRLTAEAGTAAGTFAFKNGSNYLTWTSGNSLNVASSKSDNTSWSLTFSSDKITAISCAAPDTATDPAKTRQLFWNGGSPRFACYVDKTDGSNKYYAPQIYKLFEAVESIIINNNPETLTVGGTYQLTTTIQPATASVKTITWTCDSPSIISIDSNGLITALSTGTASIYVTVSDGTNTISSTPISITVQEAAVVNSITVEATPSSGVYTNVLALNADVDGSGPGYDAVNWSIDDPDIATLVSTGAHTATATLTRNIGSTTVTATSAVEGFESIYGSCTITNNQIYVDTITIDPATETNLTVGLVYPTGCTISPETATVSSVTWTSSDPTVATVANDEISALSAGNARITVVSDDGHASAYIDVTVHEPVGQIYLDKEELSLTVGESYDLICSECPFNKVEGVLSTALGSGSVATEDNQVVVGTYNEETDSLFIVGNGNSEATRANAFEVTSEGKAIAGSATVSSDSGNTLTTKNYADSSYLAKTRLVSILTSDWANSSFTHSLSPVVVGANDVLFVTPTDDCAQEYYNCGIQRTLSQDGSSITLTAATVPSNTITIQIVYFKGQVF